MASERKCCVPGCNRTREDDNVILHKFPNPENEPNRFNTWTFAIGGDILSLNDIYVYKYRRVCHQHFEKCYWTRNTKLTNNATPTLQLKGLVIKRCALNDVTNEAGCATAAAGCSTSNEHIGIKASISCDAEASTSEEAAQVVALLQQGLSQRAVAAQLHLSQSAVSRVYRRFQETGAFNRRPRTGRHRCTSERDDRFIVSTSLRNRHLTGVDVQQELRRVRQVAVSEWTVRRRLKEANLTPKRPASGPKLTAGHRQARLQFAREHLDWSIAQWRSVLFTDECRVCLHGSDRRGRVYRRPGERFAQCCFAETVAYGGGSCMMWAGISLEGKTALVFVPGGGRGGGLTADRYITDILLGHVVPYAEFVGEDFVLMHDNARCHTARVSRQFLREKELRTMDWPALSPDLNPIEHLWDELKRRVRARNPVPASVDELKTALLEEWDGIPQETVKKLIRSMRNRLQAIKEY
ncbi:unnamed protein product [Plutella xylostella]|uniref:(diamondback moth) hypothetical protein n=1 Tax=Plutella xylostella TaxID=51655 RepID=A0A8S4G0G9_PLUXY|nr:unnamed protein product [Plutella xylostella]